MDARKYAAELIGTFILVVGGSMSIVAAKAMEAPVLLVAPFGFGLALLAAIQATGHVSGGHYNPAVTLGAFLDRRIDAMNAVGYVVAQIVGAIAASGVVLLFADQAAVQGTASGFADGKAAVAFSLFPVSVADLMNVSDAGEIMPPKSTWFEPKLRDGLLIHLI